MKVIFDCEIGPDGFPSAYHFVETEITPVNKATDPNDDAKSIDVIDVLKRFNADKSLLKQGGWLELSKLPGVTEGSTRWDVFCEIVNRSDAPADLKAHGFNTRS